MENIKNLSTFIKRTSIIFFGFLLAFESHSNELAGLENIITVSQNGGDFTDINSALESIFNASEDNRYLILVGPGLYVVRSTIRMKPYVNIRGSGRDLTELNGRIRGSDGGIVEGARDSILSDLSITNLRNLNFPLRSAIDCLVGSGCTLQRLNIRFTSHPRTPSNASGIYVDFGGVALDDVNVQANKDRGVAYGIFSPGGGARVIVTNSTISGQTSGIKMLEDIGSRIENSRIFGGETGFESQAFSFEESSIKVERSLISGRIPIRIIRDNLAPDIVLPNSLIRRSTLRAINSNVYVELIGVATIECFGNDNDAAIPLDRQCIPQ